MDDVFSPDSGEPPGDDCFSSFTSRERELSKLPSLLGGWRRCGMVGGR